MPFPSNSLLLVSACFMGALSAFLAYRRGRNPYVWFAVGFFFGIFGIMAVFFAPSTAKKVVEPAVVTPPLSIQGPKDKFWYYVDASKSQQGPLSHDALTAAWQSGKLDLSTFVWNEELPEWKLLKDFVS